MDEPNDIVRTKVAGYRIEALIGRGGMAEVYRATDLALGRPVAIKVLAARLSDGGEQLLRESRLAAGLDHPNVIPIYEAGESDGRIFIAMRYVPGGDLRRLIRRGGPLPPRQAVPIFAQVAGALDAAHRRGLVHRDVKPSNILIDDEGGREHCYLADFGLTQSAGHQGHTEGQMLGTVDYISPEQIRGDELDGAADQYSLACLAFKTLTGRLPFERRSEVASLFAHLEEEPQPASEVNSALPAAIDAVLVRGMAKDPAERFPDCEALVAALAEALGVGDAAPHARRTRWTALAVVASALAVAAAIFLANRDHAAATPSPTGALVRIDPGSDRVTGRTVVAGYPGELAVTPGGVWAADFRSGVLWRYQPGSEPERITSAGEPRDIAALGDRVFVAADGRLFSGFVSTYDAITGIRRDSIDLLACALATGEGLVWAAGCPYVDRLSNDERPLRKLVQRFLPYRTPQRVENTRVQFREMAIGEGSVWVLGDALDRRLWRLDGRSGAIEATLTLPFPPTSIAVADGLAWITDGLDDRVYPLEVKSDRLLAPVAVGAGASGVAAAGGRVWVANTIAGTVSRIDSHGRRVVATIEVGGHPRGLAIGGGKVWVSEHEA
jgi:YVTN family beta-propeller protein